jgi:hypothetical protein
MRCPGGEGRAEETEDHAMTGEHLQTGTAVAAWHAGEGRYRVDRSGKMGER